AEFGDDLRAGSVTRAENAGDTALGTQCFDQPLREARHDAREVAPVQCDRDAGDFPMSGLRILASGLLGGAAGVTALPMFDFKPGRNASGGAAARRAESERRQVRQPQLALAGTRGVGLGRCAALCDMAERVGATVAIVRGIRRAA